MGLSIISISLCNTWWLQYTKEKPFDVHIFDFPCLFFPSVGSVVVSNDSLGICLYVTHFHWRFHIESDTNTHSHTHKRWHLHCCGKWYAVDWIDFKCTRFLRFTTLSTLYTTVIHIRFSITLQLPTKQFNTQIWL